MGRIRGVAPRTGLPCRRDPPREHGELRAHRLDPRPHRAPPGRPARSAVADRGAEGRAPGRDIQPRGAVVRADVVAAAGAHRGVRRRRGDARARGDAARRARVPLLPGPLERDVRPRPRDAAARDDPVPPPEPVRRREGLRPLHHGQLPRELRPVHVLGHPVQPRVAAPGPRVRHPQGQRRRRSYQARAREGAADGESHGPPRLGFRRRLRRGHVAHAAAARRRRLRGGDRRDALGRGAVDRVPLRRPTGASTCARTPRSSGPRRSIS
jgi:hypothetical protein